MDIFHWCALCAGAIAKEQGKLDDSEYVKKLSYEIYEAVLRCKEKR